MLPMVLICMLASQSFFPFFLLCNRFGHFHGQNWGLEVSSTWQADTVHIHVAIKSYKGEIVGIQIETMGSVGCQKACGGTIALFAEGDEGLQAATRSKLFPTQHFAGLSGSLCPTGSHKPHWPSIKSDH